MKQSILLKSIFLALFLSAMTVTKDLMANLLLAAGGRGGINTGGGGSNSELANWDGTKKKTGWGRG